MNTLRNSAGRVGRLGEFERIATLLAPLAEAAPGALGLSDDAALVDVPLGRSLVVTADALVAGVHFIGDEPPDLIAAKLLRVNVSDLAAMGALPMGYLMTMALPPDIDDPWLAGFVDGLARNQAEFGMALLGGDSVATTGPACFSLTAFGSVATGRALTRSGACPGDLVFVSGTLGDGALGLRAARGALANLSQADQAFLADRYRLPRPRVALGQGLVGLARAAMDVSDGLVADLGHICAASGVGAVIEAGRVPLSAAARAAVPTTGLEPMLGGGDDYELLFTVAPSDRPAVADLARAIDLPLTEIGRIEAGTGTRVLDAEGSALALAQTGYRHGENPSPTSEEGITSRRAARDV